MNCEQVRQTVLESFDGPIRAEFRLAMDDHLATCDACRRFAEVQRMIDARLTEALPPPSLSAGFRRSLQQKLMDDPVAPTWSESLPDIAHLAGCAFAIILLLAVLPHYSRAILVAGGGFTLVTYFLQAVLRRSLEEPLEHTL
jgi:anti-sigma factor RsiW